MYAVKADICVITSVLLNIWHLLITLCISSVLLCLKVSLGLFSAEKWDTIKQCSQVETKGIQSFHWKSQNYPKMHKGRMYSSSISSLQPIFYCVNFRNLDHVLWLELRVVSASIHKTHFAPSSGSVLFCLNLFHLKLFHTHKATLCISLSHVRIRFRSESELLLLPSKYKCDHLDLDKAMLQSIWVLQCAKSVTWQFWWIILASIPSLTLIHKMFI